MRKLKSIVSVAGLAVLAGCAEEVRPVSVQEFMDNPRLLEATMVRCGQNRATMKYEAECVNAREAVNRIEAAEEKARRVYLEEQSERKRQALRRNQEAAAEARRRALEAQRLQEEAEYLGLFEESLDQVQSTAPQPQSTPPALQPQAAPPPATQTNSPATTMSEPAPMQQRVIQNDPAEEKSDDQVAADLKAIREELQRRREEQQANNQQ